MMSPLAFLAYAVPAAAIVVAYSQVQRRLHRRSVAVREASHAAGLTEPPALHPVIDADLCIGSFS
ncbi:MAG: 4Fe-4S ferredoxin, partial [Gammaproteobacteria bacterium]|nr:4Fe-4S ferredoxin [Gammaproteobacteria bacterium]